MLHTIIPTKETEQGHGKPLSNPPDKGEDNKIMKKTIYISLYIAALMLSACSGEENFDVQHPDGYDQVQFKVAGSQAFSRADDGYRQYNSATDPTSMSVWGTFDHHFEEGYFTNTNVTFNAANNKWSYASTKYWDRLPAHTTTDFFAFMPYSANATLNVPEGATSATINCPITLRNGFVSASLRPLFCHQPVHDPEENEVIQFNFDQALCGYQLMFQLGKDMGAIRSFIIKSVEVAGEDFASSCTLSRTYTLSSNTWSAGAISYNGITRTAPLPDITIPYKNNGDGTTPSPYDDTHNTLRVTYGAYRQWGETLCVIPKQQFTPTFVVKYDVVVTNENGQDITTRNAESRITFNNYYFPQYDNNLFTASQYSSATIADLAGNLRTINILIVPKHLYVLADADQTAGYLLIE